MGFHSSLQDSNYNNYPHNEAAVYDVDETLHSSEGANIPTDIKAEEIGTSSYDTLTLTRNAQPARRQRNGWVTIK